MSKCPSWTKLFLGIIILYKAISQKIDLIKRKKNSRYSFFNKEKRSSRYSFFDKEILIFMLQKWQITSGIMIKKKNNMDSVLEYLNITFLHIHIY